MKKTDRASSLFQLIDRRKFDEAVEKWGMDKGVRSFSTWEMTCALVNCMVLRLDTLRDAEATLGIARSTFSDALSERSYGFFQEICDLILYDIKSKTGDRRVRKAIRELLAIDATEARVHGSLFRDRNWQIDKEEHKASVKMHVIWNVDGKWIEDFLTTPGRRHESPASRLLQLKPGKTYVFDRGYNGVDFWLKIMTANSHFVTRLKVNNLTREERTRILPEKDGLLHDGIYRPGAVSKWRWGLSKNERAKAIFRHIIYRDPETKKVFHFLTSDFKAKAEDIAAIYKKRWSVELLFRWLKGNLRVRYLPVRNKNAVKTLLAIAVIVQLLLQLKKIVDERTETLSELLRKIRTHVQAKILANCGPVAGCRWTIPIAAHTGRATQWH
jgi:hypothetical protein